jgi:uncharacterized protein YbaA (DUF1428 family)
MSYVDGFVIPVKKNKIKAYLAMAKKGERIWKKHGALDYKECVGDDLKNVWSLPFPKMTKAKPGETVFFSFIVFKSRAHRDAVNKKVMKELGDGSDIKDMPFDMKRMAYGGFKTLVGR